MCGNGLLILIPIYQFQFPMLLIFNSIPIDFPYLNAQYDGVENTVYCRVSSLSKLVTRQQQRQVSWSLYIVVQQQRSLQNVSDRDVELFSGTVSTVLNTHSKGIGSTAGSLECTRQATAYRYRFGNCMPSCVR